MLRRYSWLVALLLGPVSTLMAIMPCQAAEQIRFKYASLEISLSIEALETWIEEGLVDPELDFFLVFLNPQQRIFWRQTLGKPYKENYFNLSYIAHTSIGESFLRNVGEVIRNGNGENGMEAIRTSLVKASSSPEGLTFINALREFPTDIEINLNKVVEMTQRIRASVAATNAFMADLEGIAVQEAIAKPFTQPSALPDIRKMGKYPTQKQTLQLQQRKSQQKQTITFDVYQPQYQPGRQSPVIVITGGFGAERDSFQDLAYHLASYGFAIVIPEHEGSSNQRRKDFFAGKYKEFFEATEYIDRPQEITAILNRLEQLNPLQFKNQLDISQVGVFSHSFGGATALALAGAELNAKQLQQDCGDNIDPLNMSLFYQCYALELPPKHPELGDHRVKAVFLMGPFSQSLFGQDSLNKIAVPMFWEATDIDLATPLLLEQLPALGWLTTSDRYLAVTKGLPHAHITLEVITGLVEAGTVDRLKAISKTYQNALALAFFQVYLAQDQSYRPFLKSAYARNISVKPYMLNLIDLNRAQELISKFSSAATKGR